MTGPRIPNLVGLRFGRLVVLEETGYDHTGTRWVRVICDCGATKSLRGRDVFHGRIVSCGCAKREYKHGRKHGHTGRWTRIDGKQHHIAPSSRTWRSWNMMIQRCTSFENFLADMGERPPGTSLDRIDGNLGYSPENCRWATPKEQTANQRKSQDGRNT